MTSWADHFNTWNEFCDFVGIDTPENLEAEAREVAADAAIEHQDLMEARGGPLACLPEDDDIPF